MIPWLESPATTPIPCKLTNLPLCNLPPRPVANAQQILVISRRDVASLSRQEGRKIPKRWIRDPSPAVTAILDMCCRHGPRLAAGRRDAWGAVGSLGRHMTQVGVVAKPPSLRGGDTNTTRE